MEEKLNEILGAAELKLVEYDRELSEIKHKIRFLDKHGFYKELEWLEHEREAMRDLFADYLATVKEARELLNNWLG